MRVTIFITIVLLIVFGSVLAQPQPPDTLWTRTYGGSSGDGGLSVQQTSDGGYIIAGGTDSFGAGFSDVYLIKTDGSGNQIWYQAYGGSSNDGGLSVQQTSDGGYIIAGGTESFGAGSVDVYLIKTDSLGFREWDTTFGGIYDDYGYSVQQTTDGGYIIAGSTDLFSAGWPNVYLIKADGSGNCQWDTTFGRSLLFYDDGHSVQQTSDNGYIIAGSTGPGEEVMDIYLIKTDSLGFLLWDRTFGGIYWDVGFSVQQTSDGGYIVAGSTDISGTGEEYMYLVKTDSLGFMQWDATFGGIGDENFAFDVQQTLEGGYIMVGITVPYGMEGEDIYLIKTDGSGNLQWYQTFGGIDEDWGYGVQQTSDGGYIVAGGTTSFGAGESDVYLIRLGSETYVSGRNEPLPYSFSVDVYPNPFNSSVALRFELPDASQTELKIFDISGREIASIVNPLASGWSRGEHCVVWDAEGIPSGIYFARLTAGEFSQTQKLLLLR